MSVSKMPIKTTKQVKIEEVTIYGNNEGLLREAIVNKDRSWTPPLLPNEEVIELAAAVDVLVRAAEKYIEYLRKRRNGEVPLTNEVATVTLNNLKKDIVHLCEFEDSLGVAIELRQDEDRSPKKNLLQVVLPEEEVNA